MRVNAISAGPIRTLASSAIGGILDMIHNVEEKAPLHRTVTQDEVGATAAFLASPLASRHHRPGDLRGCRLLHHRHVSRASERIGITAPIQSIVVVCRL